MGVPPPVVRERVSLLDAPGSARQSSCRRKIFVHNVLLAQQHCCWSRRTSMYHARQRIHVPRISTTISCTTICEHPVRRTIEVVERYSLQHRGDQVGGVGRSGATETQVPPRSRGSRKNCDETQDFFYLRRRPRGGVAAGKLVPARGSGGGYGLVEAEGR